MSLNTRKDVFHFNGAMIPPATPVGGPWVATDTSTVGTPTLLAVAGHMVGTLDADDEVENLCLSFGDVLAYDIDDLVQVDFWIKCSASFAAPDSLAFGMTGNRNDTIDSIAQHALFRLIGSNAVVLESDDGTNDVDDVATGLSLAATLRRFSIEFKSGIHSVAGGLSTGGKSALIFSAEDARGNLRRVGRNQRFNMENYTGGLQPLVQLQKASGVEVPSFSLKRVEVTYREAA